MKHLFRIGALLGLTACVQATVQPAAREAPPPSATPRAAAPVGPLVHTDYTKDESWLCKPSIAGGPCNASFDATIVSAGGSATVEKLKPDPKAPVDCFYLYPTVSRDPFSESDLNPGAEEELLAVTTQLARFGTKCRLFAPMYRQYTLPAVEAKLAGATPVPRRGHPRDDNADVDDAWTHYLAKENEGRGIVLIGHSQGADQIKRLVSTQIEDKPVQSQIVSIIVTGTVFEVAPGKDSGGTFKSIPLCKTDKQVGCVVTFAAFRDNSPPPPEATLGAAKEGAEAACVNPAALGGGKATTPKSYFLTGDREWLKGKKIETPYVSTPGLLTTECVAQYGHRYLEVHVNESATDQRIRDPLTDTILNGTPAPRFGLHRIDINLALGDLVELVGRQTAIYRKAHPPP
jgi:hypothetical protein